MRHSFRALSVIALALLTSSVMAKPYYGANLSIPLATKEPPGLSGFQFMLTYDPDCFHWGQFNVLFDGGFTYYTQNSTPYHSTINIYSVAPIVRYSFKKHSLVQPYLDLSIGLAYLNQTRFEDRNLGIHFAFQDRIGLGAYLGAKQNVTVGLHAVHYSNAHLSDNNSGITVPLELDVGYRF